MEFVLYSVNHLMNFIRHVLKIKILTVKSGVVDNLNRSKLTLIILIATPIHYQIQHFKRIIEKISTGIGPGRI